MKKLILPIVLALSLTGCAEFNSLRSAVGLATTPVTVTPAMVYDTENGLKAAAAGLVGYRRLCLQKVIDPVTRNCRKVIATIQPYTIAAKAAIIDLRASVKANDQQTAINAYKALQSLITNIQSERQKAGV